MIVIKYGGHALPGPGFPDEMLQVISSYHKTGVEVALIHGGGPQVDAELAFHGITSQMVAGYRATTPEIMEIVHSVLAGQVCRTLVNQLIAFGANAVGLCASDGGTVRAKIMHPIVEGKEIDIGLVGDISATDPTLLRELLSKGFLPVISPVCVSDSGQALNLNGDLAAGAIAGALQATEVIFMTDVAGIYRSFPDESSIISHCSAQELRTLQGTFSEGMIPKVKAALYALDHGSTTVRIIDGRSPDNLIAALDGFGGTVVTQ